jgi:hypothetical protein
MVKVGNRVRAAGIELATKGPIFIRNVSLTHANS